MFISVIFQHAERIRGQDECSKESPLSNYFKFMYSLAVPFVVAEKEKIETHPKRSTIILLSILVFRLSCKKEEKQSVFEDFLEKSIDSVNKI